MELDHQGTLRRVHVVGTSGSGKTTLGARLARLIGAPHIELDAIHWRPNWTPLDRTIMRAWVCAMIQGERWVVDGNYSFVRESLWARADTLVWLDYPLATVMWQLWWRTVRRSRGEVPLWNENRETMWTHLATRDSLFLWALQTHNKHRRRYPVWLREPQNAHLRLVHLRARPTSGLGKSRKRWILNKETIMSFSLEGRVAIVTGGSRGIGQGIAEAFAGAGAAVVVTARSLDRVEPVAKGIEAAGGRALAVACHTGYDDQVKALIETTVEHFGRLDILVNNAATNPHFGPSYTAEVGVWAKTLDTNVLGYLRVTQAALPAMQAAGGGKVINVASVAGLNPMPGLGVYAVSKAAVIMLTKVLAVELGHMNVQVNAIAPGVIKTRFSQVLWQTPEIANRVLQETPAGRIGEVEDVTGAALYFASSASDYTTGAVLVIDGGQTIT